MEWHSLSSKKGYNVESYGTGSVVKLPGLGPDQSNIYSFDTTYEQMYADLLEKDPHLYPSSLWSALPLGRTLYMQALRDLVEQLSTSTGWAVQNNAIQVVAALTAR